MSGKTFKCEACRTTSETLHMRDSDGKWVCAQCIPASEVDACAGLRERLGLRPARSRSKARTNALVEFVEERPKTTGARRKAA